MPTWEGCLEMPPLEGDIQISKGFLQRSDLKKASVIQQFFFLNIYIVNIRISSAPSPLSIPSGSVS